MKFSVFNGPDWIKDVEADSAVQAIQQVKAEGVEADRAELISETDHSLR